MSSDEVQQQEWHGKFSHLMVKKVWEIMFFMVVKNIQKLLKSVLPAGMHYGLF